MTPWQKHKAEWIDCQRCELCHGRRKVVLLRGSLPCDVLFIAEAPGHSEDDLGKPLVGPAGHKQDELNDEALGMAGFRPGELRLAFTNLVGCIPLDEDGDKTSEPSVEAVESCALRLDQIVRMAEPRLIVCLGDLAQVWIMDDLSDGRTKGKRHLLAWYDGMRAGVVHPAAILRANQAHRSLMERRAVVRLANAFKLLKGG